MHSELASSARGRGSRSPHTRLAARVETLCAAVENGHVQGALAALWREREQAMSSEWQCVARALGRAAVRAQLASGQPPRSSARGLWQTRWAEASARSAEIEVAASVLATRLADAASAGIRLEFSALVLGADDLQELFALPAPGQLGVHLYALLAEDIHEYDRHGRERIGRLVGWTPAGWTGPRSQLLALIADQATRTSRMDRSMSFTTYARECWLALGLLPEHSSQWLLSPNHRSHLRSPRTAPTPAHVRTRCGRDASSWEFALYADSHPESHRCRSCWRLADGGRDILPESYFELIGDATLQRVTGFVLDELERTVAADSGLDWRGIENACRRGLAGALHILTRERLLALDEASMSQAMCNALGIEPRPLSPLQVAATIERYDPHAFDNERRWTPARIALDTLDQLGTRSF